MSGVHRGRSMTCQEPIIPPNNLLAVRRGNHGQQIICHGNDGQQHRDQDEIGNPRRAVRVDVFSGKGPAAASGPEQKYAQKNGGHQPQKIE